jgi:hypothetical protein
VIDVSVVLYVEKRVFLKARSAMHLVQSCKLPAKQDVLIEAKKVRVLPSRTLHTRVGSQRRRHSACIASATEDRDGGGDDDDADRGEPVGTSSSLASIIRQASRVWKSNTPTRDLFLEDMYLN